MHGTISGRGAGGKEWDKEALNRETNTRCLVHTRLAAPPPGPSALASGFAAAAGSVLPSATEAVAMQSNPLNTQEDEEEASMSVRVGVCSLGTGNGEFGMRR